MKQERQVRVKDPKMKDSRSTLPPAKQEDRRHTSRRVLPWLTSDQAMKPDDQIVGVP